MKTTFALASLALALSACTPYGDPYPGGYPPAQPAYPGGEIYRAIGTEPFWDLRIGRDMAFTDRGTDFSVTQPTPKPIIGFAGEIYQTPRINVNIVHSRCSDGMSDRSYPDTVQVRVDGRDYRGCGAPTEWFDSMRGVEQSGLAGDWRVVAINGRPSNGRLSIRPPILSASFGCNDGRGNGRIDGNRLVVTTMAVTERGCIDPDGSPAATMQREEEGFRVVTRTSMAAFSGPDRVRLSNEAGTIDLQR